MENNKKNSASFPGPGEHLEQPPKRSPSLHRATRLSVGLITLGFALTSCGTLGGGEANGDADATANDPLTIGVITPMTGVASLEGNALRDGFELGIEHLNADGGVFGQDVELIFIDDQGDAAISTQSAQRLIQQDEVD